MAKKKELSARTRANMKYAKSHVRQIKFSFNIDTDADILEKLDGVENKQGYIKELIRADIKKDPVK